MNHKEAITLSILLGFAMQWSLKDRLPHGTITRTLPIVAAWTIPIEAPLLRHSDFLGPIWGPALTSLISCHSILLLSAFVAAEQLDTTNQTTTPWRKLLTQALCLAFFTVLERYFSTQLPTWHTTGLPFLDPTNLKLLIAAIYIVLAPSKAALLALPAFLNTTIINTTYTSRTTTRILKDHLRTDHDWTLLDRRWSNTGYVSVLQNEEQNYRVLRCDHSLLGGEWLLTETRLAEGWNTSEPIYAVFEMLEAVRLMQQPEGYGVPDGEARALVVGLGVGTAPKALLAHGVDTTVVELDPVVHKFASKWFDLPSNHTSIFEDAVAWVDLEVHEALVHPRHFDKYDYIVHDVFTGGAEPLALFTETFIRNLRSILATNGVIAINYAGEVEAPLTAKILKTIYTVFDNQCRIYGDQPPTPDTATTEPADPSKPDGEFLNMVVFCRNSPGAITFRQPSTADFLNSVSRQHYLYPRPGWEIPFPSSAQEASLTLLQPGEEAQWAGQQAQSARRHWHIMRKVLPSAVWELW